MSKRFAAASRAYEDGRFDDAVEAVSSALGPPRRPPPHHAQTPPPTHRQH